MKNKQQQYIPHLVVLVGASCVGKSSVLEHLQKLDYPWSYPLSTTTRLPRWNEKDGKDYNFISDEAFNEALARNEFIEHVVVHEKQYGLRKVDIEKDWDKGIEKTILILEINGVRALKKAYPERVLSIFLLPGNPQDLEERLKARKLPPDEVALRLQNGKKEMKYHRHECDWQIINVNNEFANTIKKILRIIEE